MTLKNISPASTAKVVLVDLNGDPYEATGGGGGGAVTIADGADVTQGAIANTAYDGTNATTLAGYLRAIANSALSTLAAAVKGGTASGSAVANAPVTTGGRAATANPTAVTDGQVVNAMFDKLGKAISVGAIRILKGVTDTTITTSTAETTIVAAGGANVFLDLYGLILANSSATATVVTIKDDTAGTTRAVIVVPAGETRGFMLPVDSAVPQAVANKPWTATSSQSITSLFVTALYVANL